LQIPEPIPIRLLDLYAHEVEDHICLVETRFLEMPHQPKYAALSYCWGSKRDAAGQSTTTTTNFADWLTGIEFNSLSRVMQDAVIATRRLGIKYLWVDSVCILQDDGEDWARESAKMGHIYSNAFVTIGALASSSCHQGFLDRPYSLPVKFRSSVDCSIRGTFHLRHLGTDGIASFVEGAVLDKDFCRWTSRA
jgi:hypothetical protein